jgi:hypothetical protein
LRGGLVRFAGGTARKPGGKGKSEEGGKENGECLAIASVHGEALTFAGAPGCVESEFAGGPSRFLSRATKTFARAASLLSNAGL